MGQLSTLRLREMIRLCAVVVTLALIGTLIVVHNTAGAQEETHTPVPTTTEATAASNTQETPEATPNQKSSASRDRAEDFAWKLEAKHTVIKDGETHKPLQNGTRFILDFYWKVGDKELPKPGDFMEVTFPEWMSPYGRGGIDAGPYTQCSYKPRKAAQDKVDPAVLTCKFTDAVAGENNRNVHGDVHMEIGAVATNNAEDIVWGSTAYNVYEILSGNNDRRIEKPGWNPGPPDQQSPMKRGWFSSEFVADDNVRYQQIIWSLVFEGTGKDVVVKDTLGDVTVKDPITGDITLPQFFAPHGKGGGFTIARRKAGEKGYWGLTPSGKDNKECRTNGTMVEYPHAKCADLIARVNVTTKQVIASPGVDEVVEITEGLGNEKPADNNKFTITVKNTKAGHFYRFAMYTWIPASKLPTDAATSKTFATNTAKVGGVDADVDAGAKLYQRAWGRSFGEPNSTEVIISKKVLNNGKPVVSDELNAKIARTQFPVDVYVDGEKQPNACANLSVANDCTVKIKAGQSVKLVEPKPADTDWAVWKEGVFSVPPAAVQASTKNPVSVVTTQGNTLTVVKGEGGDVINVLLTNDFSLNGIVKVAKKLEGIAPNPVPSFDFTYTCVDPTDSTKVITGTKKVVANGTDVELVRDVPLGYTCDVKETDDHNQLNFDPNFIMDTPAAKWSFTVTNPVHSHTFVNNYSVRKGKVVVAKKLGGDATSTEKTFDVNLRCTDPAGRGPAIVVKKAVPGNGTEIELANDIPFGYACVVAETDDMNQLDFDPDTFILDTPAAKWEFAVNAPVHSQALINTYRKHKGSFKIAKTTAGLLPGLGANKEFVFDVRCDDGQNASVKAKGDGVTVASGITAQLGTTCTVTEKPEGADMLGFNLTLPEPKTVEILAKDQEVTVTFVNSYSIMGWIPLVAAVVPFVVGVLSALPNLFPMGTERVLSKTPESASVKPSDMGEAKKGDAKQEAPKQEAAKGSGLANTGASVLGLLAIAVALIVLGVVLVRRKKS